MAEAPPPAPEGRVAGLVRIAQGLTLSNVLVLAALAVIAVPVYVIYSAVSGNDELLDRLLSRYRTIESKSGCLVRHVQERGGPDLWSVGSGFAFQGQDRYSINVVMSRMPSEDEIVSYCETLKLMADKLTNGSTE